MRQQKCEDRKKKTDYPVAGLLGQAMLRVSHAYICYFRKLMNIRLPAGAPTERNYTLALNNLSHKRGYGADEPPIKPRLRKTATPNV